MSLKAAREDLRSFSTYQRTLHVCDTPEEEITSVWFRKPLKCTWYATIPLKMEAITIVDNEVKYMVESSADLLTYSYLSCVLPAVRVQKEYADQVRISWCHNVGLNLVEKASFEDDELIYPGWDNTWLDIHSQFYQQAGAGKREAFNKSIGNVPTLEEWNSELPAYPLLVPQPWWYSSDPGNAYPILYKEHHKAAHIYTFREPARLLRVQVRGDSGEWKTIDVDKDILDQYVEFACKFPVPELWGRYALLSEDELEEYKCLTKEPLYIREVIDCDNMTETEFGKMMSTELRSTNPCLAFFWMAQNKDYSSTNNLSNYSKDLDNVYNGQDPLAGNSLHYGAQFRLKEMDSIHFTLGEQANHFASAPCDPGYHAYSYGWDSATFHAEVGVSFTPLLRARFSVFLRKAHEAYEFKRAAEAHTSKYILRLRLLVIKKFVVTKEGKKFDFSIE